MQTIRADNYRDRRVWLSAFVKAENVEQATLWMRMDGDEMRVVNADHMEKRPITGRSDWRRYHIVLDVPAGAHQIVFGAQLKGAGQIWLDGITFEEVGRDVPVTSTRAPAEREKNSARTVEQYRTRNPEEYAKQLRAFYERDKTMPMAPVNLDFEN